MVAGMSSRFGGKIKQFALVGPNGETLIELSIKQAISAGIDKIIFIVGEKTKDPFKEMFKDSFMGVPVEYAFQTFDPSLRDKPWGTTDALVCAKPVVKENFIICNGDDLYGENAFKKAKDFLENCKENEGVAIGYELGRVIPSEGKTNRGIFKTDENNNILDIKEVFEIERKNLSEKNLTEKSLVSMNLFGMHKSILDLLEEKLINFKEQNKDDRKKECLLPVEISNLIKENKIQLKLVPTSSRWFGVTNPEDEKIVKKQIEEHYKNSPPAR